MSDDTPDQPKSFLHITCLRSDKGKWVRAARGKKLEEWVVRALNKAADEQIQEQQKGNLKEGRTEGQPERCKNAGSASE